MSPRPEPDHLATPGAGIRLLGPVSVTGPSGPAALVGARQRLVLGVLALSAGGVVPLSRLVDAVWGQDPPGTAVRTLHSHVSRVRHALESCGLAGVVVTREPGYMLTLPRHLVDVHRFEDAVRAGRAAMAAQAHDRAVALFDEGLALWQGDAFADGAPRDWAEAEADRLNELRLAASEDLWDLRLQHGEHAAAVAELDRLLVTHPTRERLVYLLMLALCRADRPAEALERYERLRIRLADELGADPGAALQQLHTDILRGDTGADRDGTTPAQLPPPPGYFAGRQDELRTLHGYLDGPADDVRLAVIAGPAGIGKTALAVRWTHLVTSRFPDGQIFLDLHGHDPDTALTPEEVLAHALGSLGVPADRMPASVADRLGLYRSLTHGRRLLVLLDNSGTADHVLPLVPTTAAGMLVTTSRSRLTTLATHHAVRLIELDVLGRSDALSVLRQSLGPDRLDSQPSEAVELVDLCGGIPLALRIAAAKLVSRPRQPIGRLVEELTVGNQLDVLSVDDSRSVRTVFASAYHALSEPAARLFRLLGLHIGVSFTAHLAGALMGESHGRARRCVDELAGLHLIIEDQLDRYRFHDLIRRYADERVREEEDSRQRDAATRRLLDWYLAVAAAANRILDPARDRVTPTLESPPPELPFAERPEATLGFLDGEHANIIAAVAYAERHGHPTVAWQLSYLIAGYFESRGHANDRIEVYRRGLSAAQQLGDPVTEGLMRSGLGIACIAARRYVEALDHLGAALALMRAGGDRRGEGHALNNSAVALMGLRRYDDAIAPCAQALAVHTANGHNHGIILGLNNIGHVYGRLGDISTSLEYLHRGLGLARREGDSRLEAAILHSIGETHRYGGGDEAALDNFTAALTLRRQTGNRLYEITTLNEIGEAHLRLGAPAAAMTVFTQAVAISRQIADQHLESIGLTNLAKGHLAAGDHETARDLLGRALAMRSRIPDEYEEAGILRALGDLEASTGESARADAHWSRAFDLYQKVNATAEAAGVSARRQARRRLRSLPT